eukprot:SAG31_NODE_13394_length_872_cov_1.715395_1_plen_130_part_01
MGTFEGCGIGLSLDDSDVGMALPPASAFAPTAVDPEQWVKALASAGVTRAVLVVSHGCGFNTFPSRTNLTLSDGRHFSYNYSVVNSPWKDGKGVSPIPCATQVMCCAAGSSLATAVLCRTSRPSLSRRAS